MSLALKLLRAELAAAAANVRTRDALRSLGEETGRRIIAEADARRWRDRALHAEALLAANADPVVEIDDVDAFLDRMFPLPDDPRSRHPSAGGAS